MSDTTDPLNLILRRQADLDRRMDALSTHLQSMTRMFELHIRDVHSQFGETRRVLSAIDGRLAGIEDLVRGFASEQLSMANQIINAQDRADQAHRRLDEAEAGIPR